MTDNEGTAREGRAVPGKRQICGSAGFLQILREMDETGETRRDITGDVAGPFFSRAVYGCVIRIGMDSSAPDASTRHR